MSFTYQAKSDKQIKDSYNRRKRENLNGFDSFHDYLNWYRSQELKCHYCGLKEIESQELAMRGILTSKRFPQNGIIGRGQSRGIWLEVDRSNPNENYSRENCILSCYYCNNDKSDIFDGMMYLEFFQNRVHFLRKLLIDKRTH